MITFMSLLVAFSPAFATATAAATHTLTFQNVRAEVTLKDDPPPTSYTSLSLRFVDANGQPADPQAQPKVGLFMQMGKHRHGSEPTRVTAVAGAKGLFEVTNVNFYMPGEWSVEVTLDRGGGNAETQAFKVNAGQGQHHH